MILYQTECIFHSFISFLIKFFKNLKNFEILKRTFKIFEELKQLFSIFKLANANLYGSHSLCQQRLYRQRLHRQVTSPTMTSPTDYFTDNSCLQHKLYIIFHKIIENTTRFIYLNLIL